MMSVIVAKNVTKTYHTQAETLHAINEVSVTIEKGEFTSLVGPSGSGKTTLLNMLGGLDSCSEGTIEVGGVCITELPENDLINFRLHKIGFVFQAYNLIPVLTARENIEFIMLLQKRPLSERNQRVDQLLDEIGMTDMGDRKPPQLSGGQQQRVAVARALASKPAIILADEPTANLDGASAAKLLDTMLKLNQEEGITFLFSTHDQRVIDRARRVITLEDGKLVQDQRISSVDAVKQ